MEHSDTQNNDSHLGKRCRKCRHIITDEGCNCGRNIRKSGHTILAPIRPDPTV